MITNNLFADMLNSPVRSFVGRVELHEGSTLTRVCGCHDNLKSFSINREGESGFFGYGICHKINVKLIDPKREIEVSTANYLEAVFGKGNDYIYPFPNFHVSEVHRDENTNELSITAYDALYKATAHTVSEIAVQPPYTIKEFAIGCASVLGIPINLDSLELDAFNLSFENGANFEGTETIREALDAIAQATQTIYYISHDWELIFKRLDKEGAALLTIDKEKYITLDSGDSRRLGAICHATELGDNVIASMEASGTTQYVRNNPFWELREDIAELVDNALAAVGGLTINQFDCSWRGNFLVEIGDKIALTRKDGSEVYSYLLNDTLEFNGSLSQKTQWQFDEDEAEGAENPTSLGDVLKQTYARVDKANKQIELVASETSANSEAISSLQLDTESISASVSSMEQTTREALEGVTDELSVLTSRVDAAITSEEVTIAIQSELANGVDKVTTSTGFTFNEEGLTVSKSGSEMETTITEDGMTVYKNNEAVLVANNVGVNAVNLHATTYLIIGTNSRLEDFGSNRTGCFYIGN